MIHNLQRIQIKIMADGAGTDLEPFLAIFGRWRHEKDHPAEWVDVADYAHMANGPGVMLIGHRCSVSLDLTNPGPGILYTARKGLNGTHAERIASAFGSCLELAKRLAEENEFPKPLHLRTDSFDIRFTDRMETPNDAATDAELRGPLTQVLDALLGAGGYQLAAHGEPGEIGRASCRERV